MSNRLDSIEENISKLTERIAYLEKVLDCIESADYPGTMPVDLPAGTACENNEQWGYTDKYGETIKQI